MCAQAISGGEFCRCGASKTDACSARKSWDEIYFSRDFKIKFFHNFIIIIHLFEMGSTGLEIELTVGVLALQGAFNEHVQLLREAEKILEAKDIVSRTWVFKEVRTEAQLKSCDALIIPGGESTAISLVAQRCGMMEPLRDFVK